MSDHEPDNNYKQAVYKHLHDEQFTQAQFRVNRAVELAKRILINQRVQNFSAADVTATASLILQEEKSNNSWQRPEAQQQPEF